MKINQKIIPNFWFDSQAEEAVNFYVSIFKNSGIKKIVRFGKEGSDINEQADGTVMTVDFYIEGQEFVALNGGPNFQFTEAISFIISCETQEELDDYWIKLIANGGQESMCGWLKDKFGVSWQVVPIILSEMLADSDTEKVKRVSNAMLQMKKLDIAILKQAYNGIR